MKLTKTHIIIIAIVVVVLIAFFWPTNNRYLKRLYKDKTKTGL